MSTVSVAINATTEKELGVDRREIEALRRILFFDGVCGLCNWSVDFVMRRDLKGVIQFAPLQGDTARELLTSADLNDLSSMVFWVGGRSYRKSAGVVRVLWQLGPFWKILAVLLWLIPLPLRNLGYSLVASNRYHWFGKKETCRLPTPAERTRFLP